VRQLTSIEAQSRPGSRRVNIFLDGQFAFSLEDEIAARFSPGCYLSDLEIEELQRQDGVHRIYNAALVLLSYRPRSVAEVRRRLIQKGHDAALVEEALERLQDQKVLNDEEFARFWVENRQSHRPRGSRALRSELRTKGVESEAIEGVLPQPEEEEPAAYRAARRKAESLRGQDWQTFRQRLGAFLVRRGFGYDITGTVVKRLWDEVTGTASEDEARDET
jgi:regulatory protein